MDIKLAVLNEYIEFIEADEDDDKWYYNHAQELAANLLSHNSSFKFGWMVQDNVN